MMRSRHPGPLQSCLHYVQKDYISFKFLFEELILSCIGNMLNLIAFGDGKTTKIWRFCVVTGVEAEVIRHVKINIFSTFMGKNSDTHLQLHFMHSLQIAPDLQSN